MYSVTLRKAADAADDVVAELLRISVAKRKQSILDEGPFVRFVRGYSSDMRKTARPIEDTAFKSAVSGLGNKLFSTLSPSEIAAAGDAAGKQILTLAKDVPPKLRPVMQAALERIVDRAKAAQARNLGEELDQLRTAKDQRQIDHIVDSQVHFITDQYGKRSELATERSKKIIADGVAAGWTDKQIGVALEREMRDLAIGRSKVYYETVAGITANRARSYASLAAFDSLGIRTFRFVNPMDERTSQICRFMHGKTGQVKPMLDRMRDLETRPPEDVKDRLPFGREAVVTSDNPFEYDVGGGETANVRAPGGKKRGALFYEKGNQRILVARIDRRGSGGSAGVYSNKMSQADLEKSGLLVPPLHGRCRSTIQAMADGKPVGAAPQAAPDMPTPPVKPRPKPRRPVLPATAPRGMTSAARQKLRAAYKAVDAGPPVTTAEERYRAQRPDLAAAHRNFLGFWQNAVGGRAVAGKVLLGTATKAEVATFKRIVGAKYDEYLYDLYAANQRGLLKAGLKGDAKETIWRGVKSAQAMQIRDESEPGDAITLDVRSASSFSALRAGANQFAGAIGVVIESAITYGDMLVHYKYARELARESEVVVISRNETVKGKRVQ